MKVGHGCQEQLLIDNFIWTELKGDLHYWSVYGNQGVYCFYLSFNSFPLVGCNVICYAILPLVLLYVHKVVKIRKNLLGHLYYLVTGSGSLLDLV